MVRQWLHGGYMAVTREVKIGETGVNDRLLKDASRREGLIATSTITRVRAHVPQLAQLTVARVACECGSLQRRLGVWSHRLDRIQSRDVRRPYRTVT